MLEDAKRPMTDARKRANAKYDSKAYDKIIVRVEAGKRDEIKAHAEKFQQEIGTIGTAGYTPKGSVNGFIIRAIDEKMERDNTLKNAHTQSHNWSTSDDLTLQKFGYASIIKKPIYIDKNTGIQYCVEPIEDIGGIEK